MNYLAKVFDYSSLPKEIRDSLIEYYQGTDRSIPNDSYHPFPLCKASIEEAIDELDSECAESYKNLLNYFYRKYRDRVIIHFDW